MKTINYYSFKMALIIAIVSLCCLQSMQAQTVVATIDGAEQTFTAEQIASGIPTDESSGCLASATAIKVIGTWTNAQVLNLQKSLKSSWASNNETLNSNLTNVDMSSTTLSGVISSFKYLFRSCTSLTSVTLPPNGSSNNIEFTSIFQDCTALSTIINLEKFTKITSLSSTFKGCSALTTINLPEGTISTSTISISNAFENCKSLTTINNLEKFTKIGTLGSAFKDCAKLTSITFSQVINTTSKTFTDIFSGCKALTTINNFEYFTNITGLNSSFFNCTALTEVRLGTNLSNITTLTNTFTGTNPTCIKYLPSGETEIPSAWQTADYKNFAIPFEVEQTMTDPEAITSGKALTLPDVPAITPIYAATKDTIWQIKKSTEEDWSVYTPGTTLDISYNNALLRCGVQEYYDTQETNYSNEVTLMVIEITFYQGGDGSKSAPYLINSEALLQQFASETGNVYGKITDDITLDSDVSFNTNTTLVVGADNILKLNSENTFVLPNLVIEDDAEIDGEDATITSIASLAVHRMVDDSRWYALALPFVPSTVTLINNSDVEKTAKFINKINSTNGLPKADDEYTSMNYDGQARYNNGNSDTEGTNNWRYKNPKGGEIGEMFAFGSGVKSVVFTITSPSTNVITEKGSTAALVHHNEIAGQDDSHRGWNTHHGYTTRSMLATQSTKTDPTMVQVYNGSGYLVVPIHGEGQTFKPFTPIFVKATDNEQNIQFGNGVITRSASSAAAVSLYCLELQSKTGELLDRLYVGIGVDTRLYNVGKMGAMGKAAVLAAKVDNKTLCSVVAEQSGSMAQVQTTINTAGRSDVYLVWTSGGSDRVWFNGSELRQGEAIAAVNGSYTLNFGTDPTGLEDTSISTKVYGAQGAVIMEGIKVGNRYVVYNTMGSVVDEATATDSRVELSLPAGIYVIKIDEQTYKVVVK